MSLIKGSITYTRAEIKDGHSLPSPAAVRQALEAYAFKELDPRGASNASAGFCAFDNPCSVDFAGCDGEHLAVRLDTLAVPAAMVRARTKDACAHKAKAQGRDKLSRREISVVKEEVVRELRLKTLPRMAHVQIVVDDFDVWIDATGSKAATVVELLEKAFGVPLGVVSALSMACDKAGPDAVALLEPARLH